MKHVAEIIRQMQEKDTGTLRDDWFLCNDIDVEILEVYESSDAWIEHRKNIGEALAYSSVSTRTITTFGVRGAVAGVV